MAQSSNDWLAGLAAGCERMLHPGVTLPAERARQRRFVGVTLAAPFLAAGAAAQVLMPGLGGPVGLALVCLAFGWSWLACVLAAATGRLTPAAPLALAGAAALCSVLPASGAGLASPLVLLLAAPAIESWWIARNRRALVLGAGTAIAGLFLHALFWGALAGAPIVPDASGWHWLVPLAYGATLWPRRAAFAGTEAGEAVDGAGPALETLFDAAVLRIDRRGDVVAVGGRAEEKLGFPSAVLLDRGFFERIHVSDRLAYLSALADLREGRTARSVTLRMQAPAGAEDAAGGFRFLTAELLADGEQDPVTAIIRDNGELVRLRERLEEAERKAGDLEIAKSRFLAAVSHELRTPLNAIIGFSDMLAHGMAGPFADPRQKDYVGLVRDSGHHLLSVVNAILDVSKIEAGTYPIRPEPFRFEEALELCRAMMAVEAEAKGVCLRCEAAGATGTLRADRRAVQQMLINLVSNAVKFTPRGGSVVLAAQRRGDRLEFSVSDDGIGIACDDLARIGRPFTQVQNDYTRQFEGAGLGLSIVKGLVALHEGEMGIESAPGEGTTVSIALPVEGPAGQGREKRAEIVEIAARHAQGSTDERFRKTA